VSTDSCSFSHVTPDFVLNMPLSVGGRDYDGIYTRGNWTKYEKVVGGSLTSGTNPVNFISWYATGVTGGVPPKQAGYPYRWTINYSYQGVYSYVHARTDLWTYYGATLKQWTLIIPPGDCSSVIVAVRTVGQETAATTHSYTEGNQLAGFSGTVPAETVFGIVYPDVPYDFTVYAPCQVLGDWFGLDRAIVSGTDGIPKVDININVFAHNATLDGLKGVPSGSYTTLFDVDRNYPHFNGVMYSYASHGNRYVISAGLKSSESVNFQNRFVGWA